MADTHTAVEFRHRLPSLRKYRGRKVRGTTRAHASLNNRRNPDSELEGNAPFNTRPPASRKNEKPPAKSVRTSLSLRKLDRAERLY